MIYPAEFKLSLNRKFLIKCLIFSSLIILSFDTICKTVFDITYFSREKCLLYSSLPRWGFMFYEYFIELLLVVIAGIFIAVLLEKHFLKLKRVVPRNSLLAFIYASVLPVCSCGVVPFIGTLKDKVSLRTIITFVVAAPLLNPYVIGLSFTVLGAKYAVFRILASFVLAYGTGLIVESFFRKYPKKSQGQKFFCPGEKNCGSEKSDIYEKSFAIFSQVLPYILIAGTAAVAVEVYMPANLLGDYIYPNQFVSTLVAIIAGVPVYFCNGADVLFLRPLVRPGGLPLGVAISFSLTSTSVCVTSLIMLIKFIGKKLTFVILACVVLITFLLSFLITLSPF